METQLLLLLVLFHDGRIVTVYIRKLLPGISDETPLQLLQLQPEADVIYVLSCKCLRRSVKISGPR